MDEKQEFVRLALTDGANMRSLCRRFGVSPTTAYKWLARHAAKGTAGLEEKSRRPLSSPARCDARTEAAVLALREAHTAHGQDKDLARYPTDPVMFLLDELPQLGHIDQIENAIMIVRSARIRLWLFAQDLDQMQKTYPKWMSMASNCRAKMFYGINELATAEHISKFVGDTKELFSANTATSLSRMNCSALKWWASRSFWSAA
jgi:transposase-like protein